MSTENWLLELANMGIIDISCLGISLDGVNARENEKRQIGDNINNSFEEYCFHGKPRNGAVSAEG